MKVVIMGSGRIGARVASSLSTDGHDVSVIEPNRTQVMNLPRSLIDDGLITLVIGDGSGSEAMLEAGIEDADVFLALSGNNALTVSPRRKPSQSTGRAGSCGSYTQASGSPSPPPRRSSPT